MTFMLWSDDFSVGLDTVDEQHRWLFDATNRLHDELNKEVKSRVVIAELMEGLMDYTMNHFIVEEVIFERHDYPETRAHKALHSTFTGSIMNMLTDFEAGVEVENEVLELLKHWLLQHIMKVDMAYVPFFKEKAHYTSYTLNPAEDPLKF